MNTAVLRFSALGDIAAALPVLRACRDNLTIVTSPLGKALLRDEFDQFLVLGDKTVRQQFNLLKHLWRQFDGIVDLQSNDRSRLLSRLAFCPVVNSTGVNLNQAVTAIFYEIACKTPHFAPLDVGFTPKERSYIVLNVGSSAGWSSKRLPLAQWRAFSGLLWERYHLKFMLTGAIDELDYVQTVAKQLVGECEVVAGKTDIQGLKQLLRHAYLTVSTDSGPMHLSAVQKTPTIGLFGATNWIRSAPFGPWSTALFDPVCYPNAQPPLANKKIPGAYYDHISLEQGLQRLAPYLEPGPSAE